MDFNSVCGFRLFIIASFICQKSESHGVMVSTLDSPHNDPGSIPGSGGAVGIWVYYPCGSATSFGWDVKPRSGLRAHAFKNMRGPKRTWMTKRKSRGPETYRYGRHIYPTKAE